MTKLTDAKLARLRALADAATPGPVYAAGGYVTRREPDRSSFVHSIFDLHELGQKTVGSPFQAIPFYRCEDAAFYAAARSGIPDLINHIDVITNELSQAQAELDAERIKAHGRGVALSETMAELAALRAGAPDGHETQATVTAWQDTVFGPPHGPTAPLMRAINEMVEACISLGIERDQFVERVNTEYDRQIAKGATVDPGNLPSEVAGVVTILYRVAQAAGFDLQQAVNAEMRKNRGRTAFSGGDGKVRPGREHDRAAAPQPPAQAVARPEAAVKAEALREVAKYFGAEGQEEIEYLVAAGYQQCAAYCIDEADRLEKGGN